MNQGRRKEDFAFLVFGSKRKLEQCPLQLSHDIGKRYERPHREETAWEM